MQAVETFMEVRMKFISVFTCLTVLLCLPLWVFAADLKTEVSSCFPGPPSGWKADSVQFRPKPKPGDRLSSYLEIAGNHIKRVYKKGQGEIRTKLSTQGVGLYKIVMMAPEQYGSKVVTIKKRKALFKKGNELLFVVADKAALRIYFRGNSLQEDNILSELAGKFDFNKLEELLAK